MPCTHSDHDIVSAFLTFGETPRGKGIWHLSYDILNNNEFTDAVSAFWLAWRERKKSFPPLTEWWDTRKRKIKILPESYSRRSKQEIKVEIHKKEKQLQHTQTKADRTGDARHARLVSDLCNNMKRLEEKQAEGAKIRSKATFLEQNEKCSKYFFNLEKKLAQDQLIKAVKDPADRLASNTADILMVTNLPILVLHYIFLMLESILFFQCWTIKKFPNNKPMIYQYLSNIFPSLEYFLFFL